MTQAARTRIARFVSAACALVTGAVLLAPAPAAQAASGKHGFVADRSDAATVKRIMERAERGDARAQAVLGLMYASGRGVPQSYDAAVDWYLQSAEQGDPDGQYLLGLMYDKGFGVNVDIVKAYKWLNLAAAHAPPQNRESVLRIRDAIAAKMTPAQIEIAQRLALDFIPARQ